MLCDIKVVNNNAFVTLGALIMLLKNKAFIEFKDCYPNNMKL